MDYRHEWLYCSWSQVVMYGATLINAHLPTLARYDVIGRSSKLTPSYSRSRSRATLKLGMGLRLQCNIDMMADKQRIRVQCVFCGGSSQSAENGGDIISKDGISAHQYCLVSTWLHLIMLPIKPLFPYAVFFLWSCSARRRRERRRLVRIPGSRRSC